MPVKTKMEWFQEELAKEDYFPSTKAITAILAGSPADCWEPSLVDFIEELEREWPSVKQSSSTPE